MTEEKLPPKSATCRATDPGRLAGALRARAGRSRWFVLATVLARRTRELPSWRGAITLLAMPESYFTTDDGNWFQPTDHARGPWDPLSCHAGPPTGIMVRELERLVPNGRLARVMVELMRPVPMAGFRVQAEVRRPGRSAVATEAEIFDEERVYARAFGLHLRMLPEMEMPTADVAIPDFEASVPGPFPIKDTTHGLPCFPGSLDVRYDPSESQGEGGPTTVWMRTVPLLPDEEPSGFQRICPLGDSGNGISYNAYLDQMTFVNPDLVIAVHREPRGEWLCSRVRSHWEPDGLGLSDAELFDRSGHVGRAVQTILIDPVV